MKRRGTYLITKARVHEFAGGNDYPPAKTFYADLLGRDRHRLELVVSRENWPEFFEVALQNFLVGRTIGCDFLYFPTGSNALEIRLWAWHEIVGAPLVMPSTMKLISEAEFFDTKKITAFVLVSGRNLVYPEPIPLDGQVAIRWYDESEEYNLPLIGRGDRAPGRLVWVPYPSVPESPKQIAATPTKENAIVRLFRWLSSP